MRALIPLVLGIALFLAGWFWYDAIGFSVLAMVAALVMAAGGALVVAAWATFLDMRSPTSRKL